MMGRIVYMLIGSPARPTGGHKVSIRHVEALNELGFEAVVHLPDGADTPKWFEHRAPMEVGAALRPDDIVVLPEDATDLLRSFAPSGYRKVVFCQNHFYAAATGLARLQPSEVAAYNDYMACSPSVAAWIARFLQGTVEVVPAFADERQFLPAPRKRSLIACTPRKRPVEMSAIRFMFRQLYRGKIDWSWSVLQGAGEPEVVRTFGEAALFLSLNRLEAAGITTLEAMASGCIVAGFTGIGCRDYTSSANGFWVEEDDCEAAARALVRAAELVEAGGSGYKLMRKAARETAEQWSHRSFLKALEAFWRPRAPTGSLT